MRRQICAVWGQPRFVRAATASLAHGHRDFGASGKLVTSQVPSLFTRRLLGRGKGMGRACLQLWEHRTAARGRTSRPSDSSSAEPERKTKQPRHPVQAGNWFLERDTDWNMGSLSSFRVISPRDTRTPSLRAHLRNAAAHEGPVAASSTFQARVQALGGDSGAPSAGIFRHPRARRRGTIDSRHTRLRRGENLASSTTQKFVFRWRRNDGSSGGSLGGGGVCPWLPGVTRWPVVGGLSQTRAGPVSSCFPSQLCR